MKSSLPKWIKVMRSKEYQHRNGHEIFVDLEKTVEALAIAWEALEKIHRDKTQHDMVCGDAMRRIRELGDK